MVDCLLICGVLLLGLFGIFGCLLVFTFVSVLVWVCLTWELLWLLDLLVMVLT